MGQWRDARPGPQQYPRVPTNVPVRVSTVDPEADPDTGELFYRSTEETTANLSQGGAFVRSWEPLAAGRRVFVEIELPNGLRLQLPARVVWTRRQLQPARPGDLLEPGYGVEFIGGSKFELAGLEHFLKSLERRAPSPASPEPRAAAPQP